MMTMREPIQTPAGPPRRAARRLGMVLYAVMAVIAMAALIGASLMFRMQAELAAAEAGSSSRQAYLAAFSGIERAVGALAADGVDPFDLRDDEEIFKDQLVFEDGNVRWFFTVYASNGADREIVRYGVTDESGKININQADRDTLLGLPNMTEELADSLLDYIDADSDPRPSGAEQEYYARLAYPYLILNQPLATLEELLLVKGFHAGIVYGEDANRNGVLDANENDGDQSFPPDNADGVLDLGLADAATVSATSSLDDSGGGQLIDLNGDAASLNQSGLPQETLVFIAAYRDAGNEFSHPSELLNATFDSGQGLILHSGIGPADLPDLLDRFTAVPTGSATPGGGAQPSAGVPTAPGGLTTPGGPPRSGAPTMRDLLGSRGAVGRDNSARGRRGPNAGGPTGGPAGGPAGGAAGAAAKSTGGLININAASPEALAALKGVTIEQARRIVETRDRMDSEWLTTPAWLVTEGLVSDQVFKDMAPLLTTEGAQYRIRCIGFGYPVGQFCILEAVVDLSRGEPRITYMRDITRLGMPFAIDAESLSL